MAYLLNGCVDNITSDQYCLCLTQAQSTSNCLILDRGVPLWFHDEDPVRNSEIQTEEVSQSI